MNILAVDDMPLPRKALEHAIQEAATQAHITTCASAAEALAQPNLSAFEVAFLDIDMHDMGGIELAYELKRSNPRINVVFVTGYGDYMADAFSLHSSGYVMKPVTAEKIRIELENLRYPPHEQHAQGKLVIRCFGNFEAYANGEPIVFSRTKTKELLAYLVNRRGALCDNKEIQATLWENRPNTRSIRSYFRTTVADLRATLRKAGHEDIIIKRRGSIGVRIENIICDYYRYLEKDPLGISAYHGEYMQQYSWAELTRAALSM